MVVIEGWRPNGDSRSSVEVVDTEAERRCNDLPNYPNTVVVDTIAEFYLDRIVVCREAGCHQYDQMANKWTWFGNLKQRRYNAMSSIINGALLVTGGQNDINSGTRHTTEYYDGGSFVFGPNLPVPMKWHCQITINNTHVFFADTLTSLNTYLLNWGTKVFTSISQIPNNRSRNVCGLTWSQSRGEEIVVVGNEMPDAGVATSDIFSLSTMSWRQGPNLSFNMEAMASAQIGYTFAFSGGCNEGNVWSDVTLGEKVVKYDPEEDAFTVLNVTLKDRRCAHSMVSVPSTLVSCPGKPKSQK